LDNKVIDIIVARL